MPAPDLIQGDQKISHRVYVMGDGRIVFEGTPADLKQNEAVRKEWLEV